MQAKVDHMKCGIIGICVKDSTEFFGFQPGSKQATAILDGIFRALKEKCCMVSRFCPSETVSIEEYGARAYMLCHLALSPYNS
jgi:hypothetical protein